MDTFVIMPNHFHCAIFIVDNEFVYPVDIQNNKYNFYEVNEVDTIHELYLLKMQVSKQINLMNKTPGINNWQYHYYDSIIKTTSDYQSIKKHIVDNPKNWK